MRLFLLLFLAGCTTSFKSINNLSCVNSVFKIERYKDGVLQGNSTGVAVKTINNVTLILTNRHVCHDRGDSDFVLIDNNLARHDAIYYKVHSFADLCLLKTKEKFSTVEFGVPVLNEQVTSIGAPHGAFPIYNTGVVKIPITINSRIKGENYFFLAQSVSIDSDGGSSGSPVFNSENKVVGILFATSDGHNSFMVPSDVIIPFLKNVIN